MSLTKIISGLVLGAALTLTPAKANADYFDGCRGPNKAQLDQRVTLGDGAPSYTLLPKAFIDADEDGNGAFVVAPVNYTPKEKPSVGVGVGGFFDLGKVKLLGVVPVVYSAEGEVVNINPTLYATMMAGNFVFDPRISYLASIAEKGTSHNVSFGATIGYKIDDVILGFDVGTSFNPENPKADQLEQAFDYQGIIRVDLDKEHKHWVQAYLGKDAVGIGFRANFDLK
jgi:hypothetical protein